MPDLSKTYQELIEENSLLKMKIRELEQSQTESEKTADTLRESESHFRELAESLPEAVYEADNQGILTFVNRDAYDMFGYTVEEFSRGLNLLDMVIPDERQRATAKMQKILSGESKGYSEMIMRRKDGSTFPALAHSTAIIRDGRPAGLRGVIIDITQRKKMEEELRESQRIYAGLVDTIPDIFLRLDLDGNITFINELALEISGYRREEAEGRSMLTFVAPEDHEQLMQNMSLMMEGRIGPKEYGIISKDGRAVPFEVNGDVLRDENGTPLSLVFICRDITERKRAEQELQQSEDRYRTIIEEIEDSYQEVDLQGNYTFINKSFAKLLGYRCEEIMGTSFRHYSADKANTEKIYSLYNEMYRTGRPLNNLEWDIVTKQGARRTLEFYASIIRDVSGHPTGFRGIGRDITDRRQAEEQYKIVADGSQAGIFILQDGVVCYANPHISAYSGYTQEEILGASMTEFIHPEDRPLVREKARKMLRGEPASPYEYRIIDKQQRVKWLMERVTSIKYRGNQAVLGSNMDITQHKLAEEALRLTQFAMDRAPDSILWVDELGRIVYANHKACSSMGYQREEMEGMTVFEMDPDFPLAGWEQHMIDLKQKGWMSFEGRHITKSGGVFPVEVNANYIDYNGRFFSIAFDRDITERKRMEADLQHSHSLLRATLESTADGILVVGGTTMTIIDYNQRFAELWNIPRHLLASDDNFLVLQHITSQLKDPEAFFSKVLQIYSQPEVESFDVLELADGRIFEQYSQPQRIEGQSVGRVWSLRDITDSKRVEEALRESEDKFRILTEKSMVGIYLIQDRLFRYVNAEFAKIFGYAIEEIVDRMAVKDVIFPDDWPTVEERLRQRLSGELESIRYQFRIWTKTREIKNAEVFSSRTLYQGKPAVIGTLLDITERCRAEEELRRLSIAIEQAAEDILITDPEGVIQYVNPAFEKITGYSRLEAISKKPSILKSGVHDSSFYADLWNTIKKGNVWTGRITNRRKDGKLIYEDTTISPLITSAGKLTGYVSLKRDVTENVRLEAHLRQAQKMETIGTLAGGIAHDFNNILAGMMGFAELAKIKTTDDGISSYIGHILHGCDRARDLVKQILTFSRQTEQIKKPVMMIPLIKEIAKFMRASLPATIEIKQSLNTLSDVIMADATQIHQLLMNLCMNAGHAMRDKGGVLEIALDTVGIDEQSSQYPVLKNGRYLHLTVSDTGHGIDKDQLEKIFEPYFTTKSQGEGTGLGLSVVDGIVKSHGGAIRVYSEVGMGSVFHVYLPLIEDRAGTGQSEEIRLLPVGSETILFVDDEAMVAQVGKLALEDLGYRVVTETDPTRAIALFRSRKNEFDLVITDKTMPHMTGFELAREVKSIRNDIPVIMCSGFQDREDMNKLAGFGVNHFLNKPTKISTMAEIIRNVLDNRQQ